MTIRDDLARALHDAMYTNRSTADQAWESDVDGDREFAADLADVAIGFFAAVAGPSGVGEVATP
jgi:hypothetical protein